MSRTAAPRASVCSLVGLSVRPSVDASAHRPSELSRKWQASFAAHNLAADAPLLFACCGRRRGPDVILSASLSSREPIRRAASLLSASTSCLAGPTFTRADSSFAWPEVGRLSARVQRHLARVCVRGLASGLPMASSRRFMLRKNEHRDNPDENFVSFRFVRASGSALASAPALLALNSQA